MHHLIGNLALLQSKTGPRHVLRGLIVLTTLVASSLLPSNAHADGTIGRNRIASRLATSDFDGDGIADYAVKLASTGEWDIQYSSTKQRVNIWPGLGTLVPGDYDGDGKTDAAIWRKGSITWQASSGSFGVGQLCGEDGDLPVANDFDGDGKTDYAVWRPSNGTWYVVFNAGAPKFGGAGTKQQQWGTAGDVPVTGDYDADGKADFAVWRPSEGRWWIIDSSTQNRETYVLGNASAGDVAAPGDYDGDGRTDVAVVKLDSGRWTIRQSSNGAIVTTYWGATGDVRAANDFDGDGATDIGVWRNSTAQWFHIRSSDGGRIGPPFGSPGDVPISSAFMY
jgi:VCBS repeat protein